MRLTWVVALVGDGLGVPTLLPYGHLTGAPALGPAPSLRSATGSGLAVSPTSWVMVAGASASFRAYLVPASNGCIPMAAVFTWQLANVAGVQGYLNATVGAVAEFVAFPYADGPVSILVSATGYQLCSSGMRLLEVQTEIPVRVVSPLRVDSISASPAAAAPGQSITVRAVIDGGDPPYAVEVSYGDGSGERLTRATTGTVAVVHAYARGNYTPSVRVADALGEYASSPPACPLEISPEMTMVIVGPGARVDSGVPFRLAASVANGIGSALIDWNDSRGDAGAGPSWTLNLSTAGVVEVAARATDSRGNTATASAWIEVLPGLNVSVRVPSGPIDLGEAAALTINLTGGSPPFQVAASALPTGSTFVLQGLTQRSVLGALLPGLVGPFWAEVSATDALGARCVETVPAGVVTRQPYLTVNLTSSLVEAGVPVGLVAMIVGGAPPFAWSLSTTGGIAEGTPLQGTLARPGPFAWTGSFATAGSTIVEVSVEDAGGTVVEWNTTVLVRAALSVALVPRSMNRTVGAPLPLTATVRGGAGPYNLTFAASDGEFGGTNLSSPGLAGWAAHPSSPGPFAVQLLVTDASGRNEQAWTNLTLVAPPAAPAGPDRANATPSPVGTAPPGFSADFGSALGAVLGVGLLVGVGWFLLRGRRLVRRPTEAGRTPESARIVRRLLRENDGVDRETLQLLAEEEGVAPASVDSLLRRWEAAGCVRHEPGEEDEELYHWRPRAGGARADALAAPRPAAAEEEA